MRGSNAVPVRQDEVEAAAAVIARAFHEDELNVHLYPDDRERSRLAPAMFEAIVRYDFLFGQVDRLPELAAVATWLRPGDADETPERLTEAGFDDLPDEVPLDTLGEVFAFVEQAHARAIPEPHWYLRLLGVAPGRQRRGLGGALLKHGLARASDSGHPCFLETFSERNVPFYLHHGFELVVEDVEPVSGLRFWSFLRSPEW